MKKQLLLTLMIGYTTLAIIPINGMDKQAIAQFDPNYKPESISLPKVYDTFQPWVDKVTKRAALATGILGIGASAAYFYKKPDLQTLKHAATAMGATAGAAVLSALIANKWAKSKVNEYTNTNHPFGQVVKQHNDAVIASAFVDLTYEQREDISELPFNAPAEDAQRLGVYNGVNILPRCVLNFPKQRDMPWMTIMNDRVFSLSQIATALEAEAARVGEIDESFFNNLAFDLSDELREMKEVIVKNKKHILELNTVLSHKKIRDWCENVKENAPEYIWERKHQDFIAAKNELETQEFVIKSDLVRLAMLYGNSLFYDIASNDAQLKARLHACWSRVTVYYPNTLEGNALKNDDIQATKNRIGENIENYKKSTESYHKAIDEFRKNPPAEIPDTIKSFIQKKGIHTFSLCAYQTNDELLQYEDHLHKGPHFLIWIRGVLFRKS